VEDPTCVGSPLAGLTLAALAAVPAAADAGVFEEAAGVTVSDTVTGTDGVATLGEFATTASADRTITNTSSTDAINDQVERAMSRDITPSISAFVFAMG
jgi:hypothetical protein